jgi:hypothetical protein
MYADLLLPTTSDRSLRNVLYLSNNNIRIKTEVPNLPTLLRRIRLLIVETLNLLITVGFDRSLLYRMKKFR